MQDKPIIIYRSEGDYHLDQFRMDLWRFIGDHPFWVVGFFAALIVFLLFLNRNN